MNPVSVIPHRECNSEEEVEFMTSTQYVIVRSILGVIMTGGAQVREMVKLKVVRVGEVTVRSKPSIIILM